MIGAQPVAAEKFTWTVGPGPEYVQSHREMTVTIGDIVTFVNNGEPWEGVPDPFDFHVLEHQLTNGAEEPDHWLDVILPVPGQDGEGVIQPTTQVWNTKVWNDTGEGAPGYNVEFDPITEPTVLEFICGFHKPERGWTGPPVRLTVNVLPEPAASPTPTPEATPTPQATPTPPPTPTPDPTGSVQATTDGPTLPPTDAVGAGSPSGSGIGGAMLLLGSLAAVAAVATRGLRRRPSGR
jgi:hypothetical protein